MVTKIMLIGYGSTGKYVIDMAVRMREFSDCEFTILSRTPKEEAIKRINLTLVSCGIFGFYPQINYIQCDVMNTDLLSEIIARETPDIIAYTGRYMKGLKYGEFSYPNNLGYGVWTPLAVVLIDKVMTAVQNSGIKPRVINTSYGDAVSPMLHAIGRAPYTSAGNLNHLIPRIYRSYKLLTGCKATDVTFVGSHYANTYISKEGTAKGSSYLMDIKGRSETPVNDEEVFKCCAIPTASGSERNLMIAADVVMLMKYMVDKSDLKHKIHAPGPLGLVGGYPLLFSKGELTIDETTFPIDKMIKVNEESLYCDGIEKIDSQGVTFTNEAIKKMKSVFNIRYPKTIAVEDCEAFSKIIAKALLK